MTRRLRRRRSQSRRCLFACGVIALMFIVLALAGVLPEHFRSLKAGIGAAQAIVSDNDAEASDVFDDLENARKRDIPSMFNEEVVDVSGYPTVFVNDDGSIIGFSRVEPARQAFSSIADELRSKGWAFVESGSQLSGSFVKSSGRYRWVFVSCVPVSGQASVVIQTVPAEGESG